ncbi:hypothetical protein EGW08_011021 [Elysia chlorotica]|uniref:Uncharacterized protein n=1 Tax=Elysia chlorotica TaxID=188477 RepID=A0A3S0ZKU9_ELYCH|nr:hypothetical protein EGW08_011021 [Elysia chlorotica]
MSSGREMLVVYERGDRSGDRSFRMVYVSKEVLSKARMIRIAGIIGACIFAVVLVFIILRATRCCRCLLQSKDEDGVGRDIGGSTLVTSARERDRLTTEGGVEGETTVSVAGMRREARRVQGSAASINRLGVSENSQAGAVTGSVQVTIEDGALAPLAGTGRDRGAQSSSPGNGHPEGGSVSSSDSDRTSSGAASRGEPEANELPPSYESLFLDENGDYPVEKPPEYSPPKHRRKHPPRRVHTFN